MTRTGLNSGLLGHWRTLYLVGQHVFILIYIHVYTYLHTHVYIHMYTYTCIHNYKLAQSVGAVEYTECFSAEG